MYIPMYMYTYAYIHICVNINVLSICMYILIICILYIGMYREVCPVDLIPPDASISVVHGKLR